MTSSRQRPSSLNEIRIGDFVEKLEESITHADIMNERRAPLGDFAILLERGDVFRVARAFFVLFYLALNASKVIDDSEE